MSLKVQQCSVNNSAQIAHNEHEHASTPNFKGGGFLATASTITEGIQNAGFMASFLIQDVIGMTGPRTLTAFSRDKELTGEVNVIEGMEVFLREGLTGPLMMAIAPLMFMLSAKFGKSTGVNTRLIKRFGNSLKEMITRPEFDKKILENKKEFKKEFMSKNIREMLENTVGKENTTEESVQYILSQIEAMPEKTGLFKRSASKAKKECLSNIEKHINNIKMSTSTELDMLGKIKVGTKEDAVAFSSNDAIEAMMKYCDDTLKLNDKLKDLDALGAEKLRNESIAKRFITNIVTIFTTLGVLSVIPKIYARNELAPGTITANKMKESKHTGNKKPLENENNSSEVSFKGKAPKKSWLDKLGNLLNKNKKEKLASEFEYDGINFTPTLMAVLSVFGLLFPRGMKAVSRAQVDENGKKDYTELYEILIRDLTSSLSVIFAVPLLTRAFVSSYENKRGFVLMNRDRNEKGFKKFVDLINPYSRMHVLSNAELNNLYGGVDSKAKMLNFCKYIDTNNGDLQKILSKSENYDTMFKDSGFTTEELKGLTKKERNQKITEFFEKLGGSKEAESAEINESIKKLMNGTKHNKILSSAKGLNSIPALISLVVISPFILGILIPKITYANTRRIHDKQEKERQKKINTAA